MLCIRNVCFHEVSDKRSFYKIKKEYFMIKLLKVLELDPYPQLKIYEVILVRTRTWNWNRLAGSDSKPVPALDFVNGFETVSKPEAQNFGLDLTHLHPYT